MGDATLSADQRASALRRLADEEFDLLVVGGGVTGAGIALDAACRGLSVALVEKRDYASGTSSRSSKLLHGGLRYLEQRDFSLVREALHERSLILTRLAPHLTQPISFLYPLRRHWERAYVGAGVALYDTLSGVHTAVPRHRHLSRRAASRIVPALRDNVLTGAVRYYDGHVDDARFVLALLRTAAARGAVIANAVAVSDIVTRHGRVTGAVLTDTETGQTLRARARVVVNAAGVWAPSVELMAGVPEPLRIRASKGVHLLVPRSRIDSDSGLILRTERSVLFVIPWGGHWVIGTTDTPYELDRDHPAVSASDVRYLLDQVNRVLRTPLDEGDIVGVYAGLRPLVEPPRGADGRDTTKISREHLVRHSAPGLVTIAGGKFTTYRVMARDAVDAAALELGVPVDPSSTEYVPLHGAVGLSTARSRAVNHPGSAMMTPRTLNRLVAGYGAAVTEVLDLIESAPELAGPLPGGGPHLAAEVVHATRFEGALHVDDVLTRRTRLSITAADRGYVAVEHVAALMAACLDWDTSQQADEVERYRSRLAAETAARQAVTEDAAAARRSAVRDPRLRGCSVAGRSQPVVN